jgi:hypothetical protein
MLAPDNKAILCSFASEKMAYKRHGEQVSAWCATKLHVPQELGRAICQALESPDDSRSSELVVVTAAKD